MPGSCAALELCPCRGPSHASELCLCPGSARARVLPASRPLRVSGLDPCRILPAPRNFARAWVLPASRTLPVPGSCPRLELCPCLGPARVSKFACTRTLPVSGLRPAPRAPRLESRCPTSACLSLRCRARVCGVRGGRAWGFALCARAPGSCLALGCCVPVVSLALPCRGLASPCLGIAVLGAGTWVCLAVAGALSHVAVAYGQFGERGGPVGVPSWSGSGAMLARSPPACRTRPGRSRPPSATGHPLSASRAE
jgi:hypothetical protein